MVTITYYKKHFGAQAIIYLSMTFTTFKAKRHYVQHCFDFPTFHNSNPGGIRTRVVCSLGGYDDHKATPTM
jgi:hypothetical protein